MATWLALRVHSETPTLREPALLSVLAPEGSRIVNSSISPDGRHLAFTATSGTFTRLWIRALDSLDARVLPGTDEAAYPFWSPDGRSVAFFSIGKLKKINISGGPPQRICDIPQAAFGGTWSKLGVILFSTRPSGNIYRVSASGGAPKAISTPDVAHGELAHLFPDFLPDGQHFLYSVINRGPVELAVRTASLDSSDARFLVNADLGIAYSPPYPGHAGVLVFAYHGALMSQPSTQRLELRGTVTDCPRGAARRNASGLFGCDEWSFGISGKHGKATANLSGSVVMDENLSKPVHQMPGKASAFRRTSPLWRYRPRTLRVDARKSGS